MPRLNRREMLLGGLLVAGASRAGAEVGRPGTAAVARFGEREINLLAQIKMLGSTDPAHVYSSYGSGRVYACIEGIAPVPLFSTHSVATARSRLRPDGSFVLRQRIVGFRTAFETENVIDAMRNPITGRRVELPLTDYGTRDTEYATARPWTVDQGTLAISDDALVEKAGPTQPKIDVVTRYANVAEVLDAAVASAASWFTFSAVDPFRPWLMMEEAGFQLWHVAGRKIADVSSMPEFIAMTVKERFRGAFDVPAF